MPEVSVVIPAYNSARYLRETLQSVLDQTYQDFEIVVVDDGSTDNTRDVVEGFTDPRIKYIFQSNSGSPVARNTGIKASAGEFISFLDADDLWLPQKLELQVSALKAAAPQLSLVYCDMFLWISETSSIFGLPFLQRSKRPVPQGRVLEELARRFFGHPSTLLVRKEVFEQIGFFDVQLRYCDDYDMLLRLASRYEFAVIPVPLVKYRFHSSQISRNEEPFLTGHITLYNKVLNSLVVNQRIRKILSRSLADIYFQYSILLIRKRKWKRGLEELHNSISTSALRIFPSTWSLTKRTIFYAFRKINTKLHLFESKEIMPLGR